MKKQFYKSVKILLLLYIVSFVNTLISCSKETIHDKYFDIRKMRVFGIDTTQGFPWNTYIDNYSNYRLILDFTDSIFYYSQAKSFPLSFNVAYASLYSDGYLGSKEIISAIYIVSDADFDSLHHAGDTLNDLFHVNDSLNKFNYKAQKCLEFGLTKKPELSSSHTFTVRYFQANGEYYTGKTNVTFN